MLPNSSFMTGHTKPLTYPRRNKALWSGLYENPLVCLNKALWSPYSWEDRGLVDVRQKVFHEFKNSHHWKSTLRFPTKCHPFGVEALVLDTQQKRGAPFRNSESRRVLKNFLTGRKSSPPAELMVHRSLHWTNVKNSSWTSKAAGESRVGNDAAGTSGKAFFSAGKKPGWSWWYLVNECKWTIVTIAPL